jgi:hypothetical protein
MFDFLTKKLNRKRILSQGWAVLLILFSVHCAAQLTTYVSEIGLGWSNNSVNTVIFRNNALTTFKNWQFTAYYDADGKMVLAKRKLNSKEWQKSNYALCWQCKRCS